MNNKNILLGSLGVVLLAGLGIGGWYLLFSSRSEQRGSDKQATNPDPTPDNRALEAQTANEIAQLQRAVEAFKFQYRMDYLPSRITLGKFAGSVPGPGVVTDAASIAYMTRVFPNIGDAWSDTKKGIVWNRNDDGPTTLEGDECLVYFLSGPVDLAGYPMGWATNPRNPCLDRDNDNPITLDRKLFFEFDPKRLTRRKHGSTNSKYLTFLDPFGSPYAYFSARENPNSYTLDCPTLLDEDGKGIQAYGVKGAYSNSTTFQILSRGPDKRWGQKWATWTPAAAATVYPAGDPGNDDIANFKARLGVR